MKAGNISGRSDLEKRMRSVVLEIKEDKAAILDDKGIVHAVKNRGYQVGQVLQLSEFEIKKDEVKAGSYRRMSAFARTAAALLALAVIGGGVSAYAAPVSTVTLNGAETVEYRLNVFDRVVGISAPEDDTDEFRKGISEFEHDVRGMRIDDAIDMTAERFEDELFVPDDKGKEPELTVRVGGLKKSSRDFSEGLNHTIGEIQNRRPPREEPGKDQEDKTEIAPENMPGEMPEDIPGDTAIKNTEENTGQITDRQPYEKSEEKPEKIPGEIKDNEPEERKENLPEEKTENLPEEKTERITERIQEEIQEEKPEEKAGEISDKTKAEPQVENSQKEQETSQRAEPMQNTGASESREVLPDGKITENIQMQDGTRPEGGSPDRDGAAPPEEAGGGSRP